MKKNLLDAVNFGYTEAYHFLKEIYTEYFDKSCKNTLQDTTRDKVLLSDLTNANKIFTVDGRKLTKEQIAEYYCTHIIQDAHQGSFQSCLIMCELYLRWNLFIENEVHSEKLAFKWAKKAACQQGSVGGVGGSEWKGFFPVADRYLGDMYRLGIGTPRNLKKALKLYKRALRSYNSKKYNDNEIRSCFSEEQIKNEKEMLAKLISSIIQPTHLFICSQLPAPIFFTT